MGGPGLVPEMARTHPQQGAARPQLPEGLSAAPRRLRVSFRSIRPRARLPGTRAAPAFPRHPSGAVLRRECTTFQTGANRGAFHAGALRAATRAQPGSGPVGSPGHLPPTDHENARRSISRANLRALHQVVHSVVRSTHWVPLGGTDPLVAGEGGPEGRLARECPTPDRPAGRGCQGASVSRPAPAFQDRRNPASRSSPALSPWTCGGPTTGTDGRAAIRRGEAPSWNGRKRRGASPEPRQRSGPRKSRADPRSSGPGSAGSSPPGRGRSPGPVHGPTWNPA